MKRILALFLALLMALSLCACGGDTEADDETAKATIVTNEGETVTMTAQELMDEYDTNEARYKKLYKGAKIDFTGTVATIKTNTSVIVEDNSVKATQNKIVFEEGWCLVIGAENTSFDLAEYSKGQKLKVSTGIGIAPFDTDFIKQVCDNNRVVWLVGDDELHSESYGTITTKIEVVDQ